MNIEDQDIALFEKYQADLLSENDKIGFETRLSEDKDFESAFLFFKKSVKSVNHILFKEDVMDVMKEEHAVSSPNKASKLYLAIAASVSLVLAAATVFLLTRTVDPPTFSDLYRPYPNIVQQRTSAKSDLEVALDYYVQGNYQKAINSFEGVVIQTDTVTFYSGLCYLSMDSTSLAISKFESISIDSTIFDQQLHWYTGLAYYALKQNEKAKEFLSKLQEGNFKFEKAQELIEQLK